MNRGGNQMETNTGVPRLRHKRNITEKKAKSEKRSKRDYTAFIEKNLTSILLIILVLLVAVAIIVLLAKVFFPRFNVVAYLSAASTFAIALLTIGYVITTKRQLDVMDNQLNEMKRQTVFQRQPYPRLQDLGFKVLKPVFTYLPPKDDVAVLSRYCLGFNLENIGEAPAIGITVMGRLIVHNDGELKTFTPNSDVSIEALPAGEKWKETVDEYDDVRFFSDEDATVMIALRERDPRLCPQLCMMVIYKNALGGAFTIHSHYLLMPKDKEQYDVLNNWQKNVSSFNIEYKHELDSIRRKKSERDSSWTDDGKKVAEDFGNECIGDDAIEIKAILKPGSTEVILSDAETLDRYIALIGQGYGTPLPPIGPDRCLHCRE
jgi:hypothetical protein